MVCKKTIHDYKRHRIQEVQQVLQDVRSKTVPDSGVHHLFSPLRAVIPTLHLELLFHDDGRIKGDVRCREGFVLTVDAHSFNVVDGKYFKSEGYSTYRESELTLEQVAQVMKLYNIEDVKYYFCQCLACAPKEFHAALREIIT